MAWTTPRTYNVAEMVTAAILNADVRDNLLELAAMAPRNQLVNGGFEVWQRGAGPFTVHEAYTADRWRIIEVGGDSVQVDREGTTKATNSTYSAKVAYTDVTGASKLRQHISIADGYAHLLGQQVTLTARVKLLAGVADAIRLSIYTDGTGGTTTNGSYHGNNTDWETLTVSVTVPSDATLIYVDFDLQASCTAYLDNAMLVVGSMPAAYAALPPAEEWARCERYYEVIGSQASGEVGLAGYQAGAQAIQQTISCRQRKAAASPTVSKVGTWVVSNCGQPAVIGRIDAIVLTITASGAGQTATSNAAAGCYITIESNP